MTEDWEARYFGEVFDRPFPEPIPRWDNAGEHRVEHGTDLWATKDETREDIIDGYRRVWEHSDAAISAE